MSNTPALRAGTSIADPNNPDNALRPNADGSINASSARNAVAVTKSDSTVLSNVIGLFVGGAGAVTVVTSAGDTVLFSAVPAGAVIPLVVTKVKSTGTDATGIVAFLSV